MLFIITIPMALLPSLVWLMFYLRKDVHPEPAKMVLKAFLLGVVIAPIVAMAQLSFSALLNFIVDKDILNCAGSACDIIAALAGGTVVLFLVNAFLEEFFKLFVVKRWIIQDKAFDEPVDAIEYMIMVALGFAAVENILVALQYTVFGEFVVVLSARFIGATLVHVLSSGLVGYFLARSLFQRDGQRRRRKRRFILGGGLLLASVLHAAYNLFIINSGGFTKIGYLVLTILLIVLMSIFLSWAFRNLQQKVVPVHGRDSE